MNSILNLVIIRCIIRDLYRYYFSLYNFKYIQVLAMRIKIKLTNTICPLFHSGVLERMILDRDKLFQIDMIPHSL